MTPVQAAAGSKSSARAERAADGVGLLVLLVALLLAQAWYSSLTTSRILDEELAESVRNPVWVSHRLVYDGLSSNVGWYALIAATWQVFGFSLIAGKLIRVAFQALSLICLAHLLVRWLGYRRALLPLAVIGSSPVILYFNTLATTYGVDLQWAPVVLWLLWHTGGPSTGPDLAVHALLGLSVMIAALMWPVCVFYVPLWVLVYVVRLRSSGAAVRPLALWTTAAFAALPFLLVIAWLENAGTWLHDPMTGSGAFRGGGAGLVGSPRAFAVNVLWMARDVTVSGSSYYLWLARPDLSGLLGWMPAALVAFMIPPLWRSRPELRIPIAVAILVGVAATTLAGSASGPPGLRRATICLAVFYAMYVLCWQTATDGLRHSPGAWKPKVQVAALALLLVHHGLALLPNAGSLKADVPPVERHWFTVDGTPSDSVEHWADAVVAGNALDCRAIGLGPARCRYAELYGAVEGYVRWSLRRPMPLVRSYDFRSGAYVPLSPETWPYGSAR